MPSLADSIETFIKKMFSRIDGNILEIKRSELANYFKCAPSQINYVLSTRFNIERGYYVESRQGGGGYIRITKASIDEEEIIKNIIKEIGNSISQLRAQNIISILSEEEIITQREGKMIMAAVNRKTICIELPLRDSIRSNIMKAMLFSVFNDKLSKGGDDNNDV